MSWTYIISHCRTVQKNLWQRTGIDFSSQNQVVPVSTRKPSNASNWTFYGVFFCNVNFFFFFTGRGLMTYLFWTSRCTSMKTESYLPTPLGKILFLKPAKAAPAGPCSNFQLVPPPISHCIFQAAPPPVCPQEKSSSIAAPFNSKPFPCSEELTPKLSHIP